MPVRPAESTARWPATSTSARRLARDGAIRYPCRVSLFETLSGFLDHPEGRPAITIAAEAIALELKALGIRHFFLVTGGDNSIWIALRKHGITQILARSEASAVYMADAYARITGLPTYVYGQYGPGAGNVAGALPEPLWSSSPVVAMPTSMRRQHRHGGEYQELEQIALFAGVTKWQGEAQIPERIPHLVRSAAIRAVSNPPGPVYAGLPSDALEVEIPNYTPPEAGSLRVAVPWARPRPDAALVEQALAAIDAAEQPVLLAGNGIHLSSAYAPLLRVAEALDLPVATSLSGKGSIPESHPLSIGTVGRYSRNYANALVREADLVVAIGTRLGGLVTDSYRLFAAGVKVVHVDADPSSLHLNFTTDVAINADASNFLEDLLAALDGRTIRPRRLAATPFATTGPRGRCVAPRWPRPTDRTASRCARRPCWPRSTSWHRTTPCSWRTPATQRPGPGRSSSSSRRGRATSAPTAPLAGRCPRRLGAQLAQPDRPVVAITGDGGFGYHVGEIETALRLGSAGRDRDPGQPDARLRGPRPGDALQGGRRGGRRLRRRRLRRGGPGIRRQRGPCPDRPPSSARRSGQPSGGDKVTVIDAIIDRRRSARSPATTRCGRGSCSRALLDRDRVHRAADGARDR